VTKGLFIADRGGTLQGRGYDFGSGGGGSGGGGSVTTIFGYNYNSDTSYQTIAGRKAQFGGRVPCVRIYNGGRMPSTFSISTNVAQEKRAAYSFKDGGDAAGLAAGNYNAQMISWLEGIWPGGTIFWTFHHEPNNSSGTLEVDPTHFINIYRQMRTCVDSANLAAGVQVFITANFMAQYLSASQGWSDSWVPRKSDGVDILSWDAYLNPGFNTSGSKPNIYGPTTAQGGAGALGKGYDTTYPLPSERLAEMFQITERTGFADSYGFLEVNGPLRNWDNDEQARAQVHQDYIDLALSPPMTGSVPPKIMLLWEAPSGANWNQGYGYNTDTSRVPNGMNNAYPNRANSPMWDVWAPYITGTPVGG
jgi:hypothetical protein